MAPPSVVATVRLSTAATAALRSEHPLVPCQAKAKVEGESEIEELKLPLRIPLARATDAPREMEERLPRLAVRIALAQLTVLGAGL